MSENSERIRIVGSVPVDDDTMIWIDHVFTMGASPDDDPGYVGLTVTEDDSSEDRVRLGAKATCLLSAAEGECVCEKTDRTRGGHYERARSLSHCRPWPARRLSRKAASTPTQ